MADEDKEKAEKVAAAKKRVSLAAQTSLELTRSSRQLLDLHHGGELALAKLASNIKWLWHSADACQSIVRAIEEAESEESRRREEEGREARIVHRHRS